MANRCTRRAACVVATVLAAVVALATVSCSGAAADSVDYAVDGALVTYNTNTVSGAASGGPQAFARVLSGFGYHGPDGQIVSDQDFGSISVVGRNPLVVDYQIADNAVYSDGKPVTCDDMVLAWAAQSGRFAGFDAASKAGYIDVAGVDCQPGQKKARVGFTPDRAVVDYTQLFTATSMMPSHVLSDQLGIDITRAIQTNDTAAVARVAQAWNQTWDLKPDLDLKLFPSSGPYRIDSVQADGAVQLVANDKWWGTPPITKNITVWPRGIDVQDRINDGTFDVVDIAAGSSGTLTAPETYERTESPSAGIEQLIFAPLGTMADPAARRALALCTPRDVIARNAGVPIANTRLHPASEDAFALAETTPDVNLYAVANPVAAREAIGGRPLQVRMGYQSPNARLATTVGAIAQSCAAAGIVVENVTTDTTGPLSLKAGDIDVLLASTGGATGSGSTGSSSFDAYTLFTGNGDNLSGYTNPQIDGIVSLLAVTVEPKEIARLLGESAPVLWAEMPTLPLYRQQRTLLVSNKMYAVGSNPTRWGAGWNMDRWVLVE